jgi:hypothetical protein
MYAVTGNGRRSMTVAQAPCNISLSRQAQAAKQGVKSAGGTKIMNWITTER